MSISATNKYANRNMLYLVFMYLRVFYYNHYRSAFLSRIGQYMYTIREKFVCSKTINEVLKTTVRNVVDFSPFQLHKIIVHVFQRMPDDVN